MNGQDEVHDSGLIADIPKSKEHFELRPHEGNIREHTRTVFHVPVAREVESSPHRPLSVEELNRAAKKRG
jgi:hypothetical protein